MKKNSGDISMEEAMRLARSDTGQQLFRLLQSQDPPALERAMSQAAAGDQAQVARTLSQLLSSPQVRALLEQLRRDSDG